MSPVQLRSRTANAPYSRRISLTERSYLMGALLAPPMAIQVFVEGAGTIDPDQLARAVATASAACPGARVVRRGSNWVDSGQAPPVTVVDGALIDFDSYDSEPLKRPFDVARGPNCEVLLITGERPTVVFRAFHAVMDGKGVMTWITEVFRALRGETVLGATDTDTDESLVARFAKNDGAAAAPKSTGDWPSALDALPDHGTSRDEATGAAWIWRRRTVPGIHAGLVAKAAVAITRASGAAAQYMVPINLRRHDPAVLSTANLTLPILLDVPVDAAWRRIQGKLVQAMMEGKELDSRGPNAGDTRLSSFAGLAPGLNQALSAGEQRATYPTSGIISELGRPDLAALGGAGFEARTVYSLPMYIPYAPTFLTMYQLPGWVEIGLSCRSGAGMASKADALLSLVADELTSSL
ncbi:hypothetical protein P3T37_004744 [Kitasatospora sp. MAA4]|uniref:hypothetical protein n=1 Tax=Kitasatospora sp. MAA4 TaxID=3035093 RepID=UPI002472F7B6|nr:hypothetical protein [Kitasatospora sp. MAA4]MDH6135329.1 hypothetical protein [Kitasatospora sp. MAA4]